jgi:MFS family permease
MGTLLLYANKGEAWGWTSPVPLTLLTVAVLFGVVFFWIERTSAQPMLNLALFASRRFSFASLSALLNFMAFAAAIFLTPFYLVFALHYSILKVGLVMAAYPISTMFLAPLSGTLSDRFGTRVFAVCGMCMVALGLFLLSTLGAAANSWDVIWRLMIVGVGTGMFQSPNNSAVMGSVPPWHLGIASGTLAAMRNVGMVLGIAVAGAVLYKFAPTAGSLHPGYFNPDEVQEFLSGLRWAYISGAVIGLIAALTSFLAIDRGVHSLAESAPTTR